MRFGAVIVAWCCSAAGAAEAQSLQRTLSSAYGFNAELAAQRASLAASGEQVPAAWANALPTVSATGSYGYDWSDTQLDLANAGPVIGGEVELSPYTVGITVSQPLFRSGGIAAAIRSARASLRADLADYYASEQMVVSAAIDAHLDVRRDQAFVELRRNNVGVLEERLRNVSAEFEVGTATRADAELARSALAEAEATLAEAERSLAVSRATYLEVVGEAPDRPERPMIDAEQLPANARQAADLAKREAFTVLAAGFAREAAVDQVKLERSDLLPRVTLDGTASRGWETGFGVERADAVSVTLNLTVPLYQAGLERSQLRRSRHLRDQRRFELVAAERSAETAARSAWFGLEAARTALAAQGARVAAQEAAVNGLRDERSVGLRTLFELLESEQELFDAMASRLEAERSVDRAIFDLLSAVGRSTFASLAIAESRRTDRAARIEERYGLDGDRP